jgi:predicted O-methyltransferase YrrM
LSKADEVLREIEASTERKFLPIIGPDRGQILVDVIRKTHPKRILEIGTLRGYSAILMAKELDGGAHITTIEIRAGEAKRARENIERAKVLPKIDVIVGNAIRVLPQIAGKFDMVFIDADKQEYFEYLKLIEGKLYKGSVIVADNVGVSTAQMRDYLDHVRSSGKYTSEYHSCGHEGVEVSTKL